MTTSKGLRQERRCGALRGGTLADAVVSALAAGARTVDRLFDAGGVAPPRLTLPDEVLGELRALFGDTVDPSTVVIRRGHVPGVPHPRAFALPGLIYLGRDPGIVMTAGGAGSGASSGAGSRAGDLCPRATPTLVHELVHLWQGRVIGPRYVVHALVEQVRWGRRAYDWRAALGLVPPAPGAPALLAFDTDRNPDLTSDISPERLGFEAHAQLVSEAYARRVGLAGTRAHGGRDEERRAMEAALTRLRAGDGQPGTGARV